MLLFGEILKEFLKLTLSKVRYSTFEDKDIWIGGVIILVINILQYALPYCRVNTNINSRIKSAFIPAHIAIFLKDNYSLIKSRKLTFAIVLVKIILSH